MAFAGDIIPEVPIVEMPTSEWRTEEISNQKMKLVNRVCAALIHEPRYYSSTESTVAAISQLARAIATTDGEFVLKLAFYVREDLGLRSTANYLLALAADIPECHPHIRKYFSQSTRLPTDVLEVVDLYTEMRQNAGKPVSIPTVLRKAIATKFAQFDLYQLGKYNHESARQSAKKKEKKKAAEAQKRAAEAGDEPPAPAKKRMQGRHGRARPLLPHRQPPAPMPPQMRSGA